MSGKTSVINFAAIISLTMAIVFMAAVSADAYRICTFKGTVVDNGWRSMTVKSNGQCAEVNVGWRTKYVPNRRPCLGEIVAVDFILEDGYMKATKVVSLSPAPATAQCYPPAPPSGTVCRSVGEEAGPTTDSCGPPNRFVQQSRRPTYMIETGPQEKRSLLQNSPRLLLLRRERQEPSLQDQLRRKNRLQKSRSLLRNKR